MLYAILITFACVVLAWVLPWRELGFKKSLAILTICFIVALSIYYQRGYSDGYATKLALNTFDENPTPENLNAIHVALNKHIQKHEDDALAYVILGRLHFASGQYPEAVAAFKRALEDYPDDQDLQLEYAVALGASKS